MLAVSWLETEMTLQLTPVPLAILLLTTQTERAKALMHDWLRDDIPCGHGPEGNKRGACIAFYGGPPLRMCACGSPPALLADTMLKAHLANIKSAAGRRRLGPMHP